MAAVMPAPVAALMAAMMANVDFDMSRELSPAGARTVYEVKLFAVVQGRACSLKSQVKRLVGAREMAGEPVQQSLDTRC